MDELITIQKKLKAPKNQKNNFGGYNYRSCEDILEAVKPFLAEVNAVLLLTDEIINIGNRFYIKATARITVKDKSVEVYGWAREAETKKGMDESQITGAASSYARKYALNGLFLTDDTKDADATNTHDKPAPEKLTEGEIENLQAWLMSAGVKEDVLIKQLKISSIDVMSKTDYDRAIVALKQKAEKK